MNYVRAGNFNLKLLIPYLVGSIPLAFIGGFLPIEKKFFEILLFLVLAVAGVLLLFNFKSYEDKEESYRKIPVVISNHEYLRDIVEKFGLKFYHIPITKENKAEQEQKHLEILKENKIDFVVLARYMQIIGEGLIKSYESRIINIHHSFLPAFVGAKPYHAAYARGVKIIGATAHYVTEELDAGPIIEQEVSRVSHHNTINDLVQMGQDVEKITLAKAVKKHVSRKTLVVGNKTIIFN